MKANRNKEETLHPSFWMINPVGFVSAEMLWSLVGALALVCVVRVLNWAWWRPRRLERALRAQGLNGTPYRFLHGDIKDRSRLDEEARAKPLPLSHNITHRVAPLLHRGMNDYGKVFFTWVGPEPRVTIMDAELAREVLCNKFGHFGKPKINPLRRFLAMGLANYDGEKWAKHRRILNPAFHLEKIKRMLPAFSACSDELVGRWESLAGAQGFFELDVWPELQSFTRDVLSRTAFGSSYQEGKRIFQLQVEQCELVNKAEQNVYIPGYEFLPTPNNKRRKAIDREVCELLRGIIKKREEAIKMGETDDDDLLGLLLESNAKHLQGQGDKSAGLTTEDVMEECKLFYFAGQETTSVLLTFAMVVLSMHPDWQAKARDEVLQVLGRNRRPDYDGLNRLRTVTMIIYEVFRLYPPGYILRRKTYKTMRLGNVTYPPGVLLALPLIFPHHDPDYWEEDASEFRPERFSEGISKASGDQVAFFPFGGGPRTCIAQNFALLEAKIGLSAILQRFSFELSPSYAHAPYGGLTLQLQHGAPLMLRNI